MKFEFISVLLFLLVFKMGEMLIATYSVKRYVLHYICHIYYRISDM
jgi:hypothetical protein